MPHFRKEQSMQSVTLHFKNDKIIDKVLWLLEHFKKDGVEIVPAQENSKEMSQLSQKSFQKIWDNDADSDYDTFLKI